MSVRTRSRPTTPLRQRSGSFTASTTSVPSLPLDTLEPAFADLSDAFTNLDDNLKDIRDMQDYLATFNESFASFLYGLNMNAFCVDFPEAPSTESFRRAVARRTEQTSPEKPAWQDDDHTFLTNETSFVEQPPPQPTARGGSILRGKSGASVSSRGRGTEATRAGRAPRGLVRGRGRARGSTSERGTSERAPFR